MAEIFDKLKKRAMTKERRLKILDRLSKGEITSEQADKELLFLFSNSISSKFIEANDNFTAIADKVQSIWQMGGLSNTMYEDYARQCFIEWFKEQLTEYRKQLSIANIVGQSGQLCDICQEREAKVTYHVCRTCEDYQINKV